MPFPIPSNAPTTGTAALWFWTLVGIAIVVIAIAGLARTVQKLFPTGNERLLDRRTNDTNAIAILQGQVHELQNEVHGLKREMKRASIAESRNREYRHALANQANALLGWSEAAYSIFELIFEEWVDCPPHYRRMINQLKKPSDIIARYPVPVEREVTEAELDEHED